MNIHRFLLGLAVSSYIGFTFGALGWPLAGSIVLAVTAFLVIKAIP